MNDKCEDCKLWRRQTSQECISILVFLYIMFGACRRRFSSNGLDSKSGSNGGNEVRPSLSVAHSNPTISSHLVFEITCTDILLSLFRRCRSGISPPNALDCVTAVEQRSACTHCPHTQRWRRRHRTRVAYGQGGRRGQSRARRTIPGRWRSNRFSDQVRCRQNEAVRTDTHMLRCENTIRS